MICAIVLAGIFGCGVGVANLQPAQGVSAAVKTFSVTSFGAKGDGVADDAPSIEKAMQAAAAAGGEVTFPCGEFAVRSLQGGAPGGRSALYLQGASGVQMVGQGHCTHVFTAMPQKSVFEFAKSQQVTVLQMRITALNEPYVETYGMDGGSAIRFTGVSYGGVSNVEVDGASAGAIYLTAGTMHSSVVNNSIHDTDGAGIWEDDCGAANARNCNPSLPSHDNVYQGNTLTNTTLAALSAINIDDGNGVSNAVVSGNTVSWTRSPIESNNEVQCIQVNNASSVSIVNNSCTGSPWNGIVVTTGPTGQCKDVTIQGNIIVNSGTSPIGGSGIVIYNAPKGLGISNFQVTQNTITTAAADGISVYSDQTQGAVSQGQIKGNVISMVDLRTPGSRFGVDVEFSAGIVVTANQIRCNGLCIGVGVNVYGSTATIPSAADNQVTDILGQSLRIQ